MIEQVVRKLLHRPDIREGLRVCYKLQTEKELPGEQIKLVIKGRFGEQLFRELLFFGFFELRGERLAFVYNAEREARQILRRHRLMELFWEKSLGLDDGAASRQARQLEPYLDQELEGAICTSLGHPKRCKHGGAIPPGGCCPSDAS